MCGIAFLVYCRYKKKDEFAGLMGAIMYTFSIFALYVMARHPYFVNAIILFPLVMVGIEKSIVENKQIFFTIIIALAFVMNFYFAYMISIIIAIYGIILSIYTYKEEGVKKIAKVLLRTLGYSILGIAISGILLLPTVIAFLNSERNVGNVIAPYSIEYYRKLVSSLLMVFTSNWGTLGTQSIMLIALPIFIRKRKENYPIFILLAILILPLLISQIGSVINAFNYPHFRWLFIMQFIFAYIAVLLVDQPKIEKKDLVLIRNISYSIYSNKSNM